MVHVSLFLSKVRYSDSLTFFKKEEDLIYFVITVSFESEHCEISLIVSCLQSTEWISRMNTEKQEFNSVPV